VFVSIEKPAFDIAAIAGEFDFERNLGSVQVECRIPETRQGLRPGRRRGRQNGCQ
jgi:hypothetical protein